jgi:hypothetical protein
MIRNAALAFALLVLPIPAIAAEFEPNDQGQIEFTMPSGNIGCIFTPKGGTENYEPADGGPELICDRVEPSYVRVVLGPHGKALRINDVGDASCCGSDNIFDYDGIWQRGRFTCESAMTGLTCSRGNHGFTMSRRSIDTW